MSAPLRTWNIWRRRESAMSPTVAATHCLLVFFLAGAVGAAEPPAAATARFARSSNAFGVDVYARLKAQPGNLALSPASLTTALAMTWGGARGATADQM